MLGLFDSDVKLWDETNFIFETIDLVKSFKSMKSKPEVFLMTPPPLYHDYALYKNHTLQSKVVNTRLPLLIKKIAPLVEANIIDVFDLLGGAKLADWTYFCDGESCKDYTPNNLGHTMIAAEVYKTAFAKLFPPQPKKAVFNAETGSMEEGFLL